MKKIITNLNDIYFYFKTIEIYHPKKVLDIGMFLKRCGCITRQAVNKEISWEIELNGIDIVTEYQPSVYEVIYNNICTRHEIEQDIKKDYDLSFCMRLPGMISKEEEIRLWMAAISCSKKIFTDAESGKYYVEQGLFKSVQVSRVNDVEYYEIDVNNMER